MSPSRPQFVQFGAGNIGRSLVGTIFSAAGYDIIFVDAAADIVNALRNRHGYRVVIKDSLRLRTPDAVDVANVDGLDARDAAGVAAAVERADLIGTAVGANVLPHVLAAMAPGLARRTRPVSILFCENLHGVIELARTTLARHLPADFDLAGRVGLVATSIGKMVPIMPAEVRARDPLEVWGEAYNTIIADGQAFVGTPPRVAGLDLKNNFQAYVERKLYVHNLGHAVCACHGFLHGCVYIAEAMALPAVCDDTRQSMEASARALIARYPGEFDASGQAAHVDDLLCRFGNHALGDTVFRVGRDLPRKLAPDDRFIGALKLVAATGGDTAPICRGIAAALHFAAADEHGKRFPPDDEVRERVCRDGPAAFLTTHAQLDPRRYAAELKLIESAYVKLAPTPAK
ncbi:MAG: mannitol-1-phosphate 5-dehydrogenase [Kiritimatiellae bacterium]|nr:mannitol-1-phosphate 5-dehydrogenase [Kiritimatiellia bacterium]